MIAMAIDAFVIGMVLGGALVALLIAVWVTADSSSPEIDEEYEDGGGWHYCTEPGSGILTELATVEDDELLDVVFTDTPDSSCIMAARCLRNANLMLEEVYKWRIHKYDL